MGNIWNPSMWEVDAGRCSRSVLEYLESVGQAWAKRYMTPRLREGKRREGKGRGGKREGEGRGGKDTTQLTKKGLCKSCFCWSTIIVSDHGKSCVTSCQRLLFQICSVVSLVASLAGRTVGCTQTHPSLSLHGVARPWGPRDHPVPDPICEDSQGLHQQKPRGWAHRSALQVRVM
jgi:hypothetical protein